MAKRLNGQISFDKRAMELENGYPGNKYNQERFSNEAESFLSKAPKASAGDIKGTIDQIRLSDITNRQQTAMEDLTKAGNVLENGYPGNKYNIENFENAAAKAQEVAPLYDAANANALKINQNALEGLYNEMPSVRGQYGNVTVPEIYSMLLPFVAEKSLRIEGTGVAHDPQGNTVSDDDPIAWMKMMEMQKAMGR